MVPIVQVVRFGQCVAGLLNPIEYRSEFSVVGYWRCEVAIDAELTRLVG
uniref:Uncharacterized protein n=1 Tax=Desertifilum tharense IPPAS B-1220 TaxID=1781255 RepID=A0ACD5H1E7_9CYAN